MNIYLDNQTTSRPSQATLESMLPYFREYFSTPVAPHRLGQDLIPPIQHALKCVYKLAKAEEEDHFVFTSSGAEAVNQVIFTLYTEVARKMGKNHFLASADGEASAIMALERLSDLGCSMDLVPVDQEGIIRPQALAESLTPRTALVSISWANGLTGVIQPVHELAAICRARGVYLHVDATHILGKGIENWKEAGVDFLTFNGDQLPAPKGTGGLFVRSGLECVPFIIGGNEQGGMRGGAFSVPACIGLGKASEEAFENENFLTTETARLRDLFESNLEENIPQIEIPFQRQARVPHISTVIFAGVTSDALLFCLNRKNLFASFGGSQFQQINHLLAACGKQTHSGLSFALSYETTEEEIHKATKLIEETVAHLRQFSRGIV